MFSNVISIVFGLLALCGIAGAIGFLIGVGHGLRCQDIQRADEEQA